ncbi:MAG: polysaccharide biosynthesis C-terminal domain-containing protein [Pirellulaceae bacterium]
MQTVLVTGADGFLGRHLCSVLARHEGVSLLRFDLQNTPEELENSLVSADVIFHLAGINRPQNVEEFQTGNAGFTAQICCKLAVLGRVPKIILSSSTQADLENPYGASKRRAEEAVQKYAAKTGAEVAVYRLPNVFGKGCRPNYNSAVATFCHNIANDLEIKVNDPNVEMKLVYIDDVVDEFMRALAGSPTRDGAFGVVPVVHQVKLGQIVELLHFFKRSRTDLQVPDQADGFTKKLYATYLSYLPQDKFSYPLKMNVDARGSFTEFLKTPERGQVSVNISKPKITKGNHWHDTKNEKFLVVSGRGVIRFRKPGETTVLEYFMSGERLEAVDIPPGYTHNIENLGDTDMVTVMWASEPFDPVRPDTVFEAV